MVLIVTIMGSNLMCVFQVAAIQNDSMSQVIWETYRDVDTLDPHKNYEDLGNWISYNVYETLFTYPWDFPDTSPAEPLLAESFYMSADGLNYTFTLRQGITFHDGSNFNATTVQMNFWRMLGRGWDNGWGPVWMIAKPILGGQAVEDAVYNYGDGSPEHIAAWEDWQQNSDAVIVLSEFQVRVRLAYPYTPFLSVLAHPVGSMISPSYFMIQGGMSPQSHVAMDEGACGTGPYIFDQWIQDDRIELSLNQDYWREDDAMSSHPQAGLIDEIIIKFNNDVNSRILHLMDGTTDACDWPVTHAYEIWNNETTIGDGTLQSLNPDIKVWTGSPTFDTMFIGFNMNRYLNVTSEIIENPFFDWELRAAVSYAFDYEDLINNILNGLGVQLQGPIPHGMFAHDDDLFVFEHDLTEAVYHWNMAMAAGLDDIWENNSYEFNIYYTEGNTNHEAVGLLVKRAIENIIADPASTDPSAPLIIDLVELDWSIYMELEQNQQIPIFLVEWTPDFADPHNYVVPLVRSNGVYANKIGLEDSHGEGGFLWTHEAVDGWIDDAGQEVNSANRIQLYQDIQDAIVEHCAYLWGYQAISFHVEAAWMWGYVYNPLRGPYFYHYYKSEGPIRIDGLPIITPLLLFGITIEIVIIAMLLSRRRERIK